MIGKSEEKSNAVDVINSKVWKRGRAQKVNGYENRKITGGV